MAGNSQSQSSQDEALKANKADIKIGQSVKEEVLDLGVGVRGVTVVESPGV